MDRDQQIMQHLHAGGFSSCDELASALGVSHITIRRDLARLEEAGHVRRTHGGAVPLSGAGHINKRLQLNTAAKRQIAKLAAGNVGRGDTIFLDAGSTCFYLAQCLPDDKELVVVTHSLDSLNALKSRDGVRAISLGGEFHRPTNAFVGPITETQINALKVDKAFLGVTGIDLEWGCVNDGIEQIGIKSSIVKRANETWVLADASKFDCRPFARTLPFAQVHNLVTDDAVSPTQVREVRKKGPKVHIAGK